MSPLAIMLFVSLTLIVVGLSISAKKVRSHSKRLERRLKEEDRPVPKLDEYESFWIK